MDGTLARVRRQQRPRYGFYVDHMVDIFGSVALMCGLGCSGFLHWQTAIAMLMAFLLLSSESYLATYTLSCFQLSQGIFGPTEIRILLIIGKLALLRSPYATLFGHRMLLFDLGGAIAAVGMFAMAMIVACATRRNSTGRSRCHEHFYPLGQVQSGGSHGHGGAACRARSLQPVVRRATISMLLPRPWSLRLCTILSGTCTTRGATAATAPHCSPIHSVSSFQWIGFHAGESCADANPGR